MAGVSARWMQGLVDQILTYGRVMRPALGVTIAPPQVRRGCWAAATPCAPSSFQNDTWAGATPTGASLQPSMVQRLFVQHLFQKIDTRPAPPSFPVPDITSVICANFALVLCAAHIHTCGVPCRHGTPVTMPSATPVAVLPVPHTPKPVTRCL
eukprot:363433-Chlamydomonas_euryale.AAC.23